MSCDLDPICESLGEGSSGFEMQFEISKTGTVHDPMLVSSCGHTRDSKIIAATLRTWRFNPAIKAGSEVAIKRACTLFRFDPEPARDSPDN